MHLYTEKLLSETTKMIFCHFPHPYLTALYGSYMSLVNSCLLFCPPVKTKHCFGKGI